MKRIFTIGFILGCLFQVYSQRRFDVQFPVDGRMRESIIVIPSSAPPPGGYPIVFMLHGTNQDGEYFYDISGWKELGEQENFITVFPTSLRWCYVDDSIETHGLRWVNGQVTDVPCSGPPQNYISDVNFLKLLAKKIADTFPVNPAMIFASGFSNGSGMIHKLAIDAGDVFAACAGSGSFLPVADSAKPVHRIPVWAMMGTKDDKSIRPPFTEIPFGDDSVLVYFYRPLQRMIDCQGVTQNFTKFETAITHSYDFKESNSGDTGQLYRFTLVNDMFHVYPNGKNFKLEAAKLFWEFFKSVSRISSTESKAKDSSLLIYPNPSSDEINIRFTGIMDSPIQTLQVFNVLGQQIYKQQTPTTSPIILKKSMIGSGIFLLQLTTEHLKINRMIIFD
ncbi:MAG: T9SS type A sorting domain-containing protein [Saprospiraceae bacterium]|nr:T9SS type A sorting domain-containing protein [Saprospiraceae bacterium]